MFKKTICIIAPVHPSTDIRVYQKEAKSLATRGYQVIILARKKHSCDLENIEIRSIQYKTRIKRFINIPRIFWKAYQIKADIYHLHNPDTLPIGVILKLLGKKVIYDTHEDFTKRILLKKWIPIGLRSIIAFIVGLFEKLAGILFDAVLVTQQEVQKRIGEKVYLLENPPISKGPLIAESCSLSNKIVKDDLFRVIYAGAISLARGLEEMVRAMGLLNEYLPSRLWLCGSVENAEDFKRVMQSPYAIFVDYLGLLPQSYAFAHMIKSDAGLLIVKNLADSAQANYNKIYEYMLFRLPFVASNFEKLQMQLERIRAGLFVNPDNSEEIAEALRWIATHPCEAREMGRAGKDFVEVVYNWEQESKKILALYEELLT